MNSELREAQRLLEEQAAEFERLAMAAALPATVVSVTKEACIVSNGQSLLRVERVKDVDVGASVALHPESHQIIKKIAAPGMFKSSIVIEATKDGQITVGEGGQNMTIPSMVPDLGPGDKVALDFTGSVVVRLVETAKAPEVHKTLWEDVGGQEDAKRALIEAVEWPTKHAKLFEGYGNSQVKGVLLYGPPGCGKTLLGRATATSIGAGFIYIKGPEILDPYVGVSERTIRNTFAQANRYKEKTGKPSVIFLDEADAILGARGAGHQHILASTIVPTFLTEMDGAVKSDTVVILSTNRPDTLDPAIIRDGRIDRRVEVSRPTEMDVNQIFTLYLRKVPLADKLETLVSFGTQHVFGSKPLHDKRSGAMVEGIVKRAVSVAMTRDIEAGRSKPSGVSHDDLAAGIVGALASHTGF